jgi:hypothetical protein
MVKQFFAFQHPLSPARDMPKEIVHRRFSFPHGKARTL